MALDTMGNRAGLDRHLDQILHPILDGLLDGGRNLIGLRVPTADLATAVSDHDQAGETESTTTLHHGGTTPHLDNLFDELAAS